MVRRVVVVVSAAAALLYLLWAVQDGQAPPRTDWTAFDNAADRVFDGTEVYRVWDAETEEFPYLYPPFALWLAVPLRLGGLYLSWVIAGSITAIALGVGLSHATSLATGHINRMTALVVAATSGSFLMSVMLGQYGGMYLLSFGLAIWLWSNDRQFAAGIALAILCMKPNIAIAVPVVLLWSRSWRAAQGFVVGGLLTVVLSLPFGIGLWPDFVSNAVDMGQRQLDGQLFESRTISIAGGFEALTGAGLDDTSAIVVWLLTTAILGLATLVVWHPTQLAGNPDRAFGVLAVFVIAANTRMYFYDGAVAVAGVMILWLYSERVGNARLSRQIAWLAGLVWVLSWGSLVHSLNAFFGLAAGAVVVVVGLDAVHSARQSALVP